MNWNNMNTACVLIGNSDNKLSQAEWSVFVHNTREAINSICRQVHFCGYSSSDSYYQNACWVITIDAKDVQNIKDVLIPIKEEFNQDSIAIVIGNTEFV